MHAGSSLGGWGCYSGREGLSVLFPVLAASLTAVRSDRVVRASLLAGTPALRQLRRGLRDMRQLRGSASRVIAIRRIWKSGRESRGATALAALGPAGETSGWTPGRSVRDGFCAADRHWRSRLGRCNARMLPMHVSCWRCHRGSVPCLSREFPVVEVPRGMGRPPAQRGKAGRRITTSATDERIPLTGQHPAWLSLGE